MTLSQWLETATAWINRLTPLIGRVDAIEAQLHNLPEAGMTDADRQQLNNAVQGVADIKLELSDLGRTITGVGASLDTLRDSTVKALNDRVVALETSGAVTVPNLPTP